MVTCTTSAVAHCATSALLATTQFPMRGVPPWTKLPSRRQPNALFRPLLTRAAQTL